MHPLIISLFLPFAFFPGTSVFYTYIPHAFGRSKAPLLKLTDIQAKKDMLNVIGALLLLPPILALMKTEKGAHSSFCSWHTDRFLYRQLFGGVSQVSCC